MLENLEGDAIKKFRDVHGITDEEKAAIKTFMLGAVYCWSKNQKDQPFALRDLMGGENWEWGETPLQALFSKHRKSKDDKGAFEAAAKDAGWLLKAVLIDDQRRTYVALESGWGNAYRWKGGEP